MAEAIIPVASDWYAPVATVTLVDADGNKFPVWMTTSELEKNAPKAHLALKHLAMFQDVSVDWQGAFYEISINLAPDYEAALRIMESDLIVQGETRVEVKMGMASGVAAEEATQVFWGLITEVSLSIGAEVSIALKAVPTGAMVATATSGTQQLNSQTREDIIIILWKQAFGTDTKVDFAGVVDEIAKRKMQEKVTVAQAGRTPMQIIQKLLEESMCVCVVAGNALIVQSRAHVFTQNPIAVFEVFNTTGRLGRADGGQNYVFPILSCSTSSTHLFTRGFIRHAVAGINAATKKAHESTKEAMDAKYASLQAGVLAPAASPGGKAGKGPKQKKLTPKEQEVKLLELGKQREEEESKALEEAVIKAEKEAMNAGVDLKVESLFVPLLVPMTVVTVRGLGVRIDGHFLVTKVTHRIGTDGGTTSWEGKHNGTYWNDNQAEALAKKLTKTAVPEAGVVEVKAGENTVDVLYAIRAGNASR